MEAIELALLRPCREANGSAGFWLFLGQIVTTFGIALSNVLLFFTLVWAAVRRRRLFLAASDEDRRRRRQILYPLGAYSLCFVFSAAFSYDPATSLVELSQLYSALTLPLALLLVRGKRRVRLVIDALVAMSVVLAVHGLAQFAFTDHGPLHQRIPGPFSHYMTFSGVLLLGLALIAGRVASGRGWRRRMNWVALTVVGATLVLTLTRSAWLGAFAVAAVALSVQRRRVLAGYAAALVLAIVSLVAAAPTLWPTYWQRAASMFDVHNPSNYDRLCMLWAGGQMIADRPLVGIGPAMVREWYPVYRHPTSVRARVKHLHNTFVHMAASRGIPSLLCYLWLTGAAAYLAIRRYRSEGGRAGPCADLHLGVLFALLALNVAGLFEANWRDTEIQRWALFLLALPACLPGRGENPSRAENGQAPVRQDTSRERIDAIRDRGATIRAERHDRSNAGRPHLGLSGAGKEGTAP